MLRAVAACNAEQEGPVAKLARSIQVLGVPYKPQTLNPQTLAAGLSLNPESHAYHKPQSVIYLSGLP